MSCCAISNKLSSLIAFVVICYVFVVFLTSVSQQASSGLKTLHQCQKDIEHHCIMSVKNETTGCKKSKEGCAVPMGACFAGIDKNCTGGTADKVVWSCIEALASDCLKDRVKAVGEKITA